MPASGQANLGKKDMILSPGLIERRSREIIGYWEVLRHANPLLFDRQVSVSLTGMSGEMAELGNPVLSCLKQEKRWDSHWIALVCLYVDRH